MQKLKTWHIRLLAVVYTLICSLVVAYPVFAHDAPPGDDYQMADWMLFSALIFFGVSFIAFLFTIKRGWMKNPDELNKMLLNINEPDYYTPDWAKETKPNNNANLASENGR
jgi:hypothetical protein